MQLELFRAKVHETYPDESMTYCFAFQPIPAEEWDRDGLLLSWIDDSGQEPFAVIEIPDGSRVRHTGHGWQLQVPGRHAAIEADEVYELAVDHSFGLSIVRERALTDGR